MKAPKHILEMIRMLTVKVDLDCYQTWHQSLSASTSLQDDAVHALAHILLITSPNLRSFSFTMQTNDSTFGDAWSLFPRPGGVCMPFAQPVTDALRKLVEHLPGPKPLVHFPELRNLSLDATVDIDSILSISPNLRSLHLRIPEGFNATECRQIICALPSVPILRDLELWVWELVSAKDFPTGAREERVRLLGMVGDTCPLLERLNFQTRSFDYGDGGMALRIVGDYAFDWKVSCFGHYR